MRNSHRRGVSRCLHSGSAFNSTERRIDEDQDVVRRFLYRERGRLCVASEQHSGHGDSGRSDVGGG